MHNATKYLKTFLLTIALFVTMLFVVSAIPNELIADRQVDALETIEYEIRYRDPFYRVEASQQDLETDALMIKTVSFKSGLGNIYDSMHCADYARYWHGYQVFIKPALTVFSLTQIRYFNTVFFYLLFATILYLLSVKFGYFHAIATAIAFVSIYPHIIPVTLQFYSVFVVAMVASIIILSEYKLIVKRNNVFLFFMVVGMITNYLDLLTAPLISLGLPLIYCVYQENDKGFKDICLFCLKICLAWTLGYGFCWVAKWIIGSIILHRNVISDAIESVIFRINGRVEYTKELSRVDAVLVNIKDMFLSQGNREILIWILLLIVPTLLSFCFGNKSTKRYIYLLIALMPYLWFFVLANHTGMHHWFTYRMQMISVLGTISFCVYSFRLNE